MKEKDSVQKYRKLCDMENDIPLFSQAWWLDAAAGKGRWDVVLVEKGGEIQASMPFIITKKRFFTIIGQPVFTQSLGPWVKDFHCHYTKHLSKEKKLFQQLIDLLPEFDYLQQNWNFSQKNWLPFYWRGYDQTTRYTYVLEDISNLDKVWSNFESKIKTDIKKAAERFSLIVTSSDDIDSFISLVDKTYARQGLIPSFSRNDILRIDRSCSTKQCRKIFIVKDVNGLNYAGVYLVWDANRAYYLMGGGDPDLRNTGAASLCLWEAIKFASTVVPAFDFEGSVLESVESYFRAFGGRQTPYFQVSKMNSRCLQLINFLKEFRAALKN